MTIDEAINMVDAQKANTFSRQDKLRWLSRLDGQIHQELILPHGGTGSFSGYTADTDPGTALLVPAPWDELYLHYMQAQMDHLSGDVTRYTNTAALFNTSYTAYANHYNRTNAPRGSRWKFF